MKNLQQTTGERNVAALCNTKKGLHFDFLDSVLGGRQIDWLKLSDSHVWDDVKDAGKFSRMSASVLFVYLLLELEI